MRLLRLLWELRPSGVEAMVVNSIDLFRERGVETHVVAMGPTPGPWADDFTAAGITVHHLPLEPFGPFLRAYRDLLRSGGWDVVHVHPEKANFYTCAVARAVTDAVVVRSIHNVFGFTGALGAQRRVQRRLLRAMGVRTVTIGRSVHDLELEHYGNPSTIVPNGYDERRFHPPTDRQREEARAELGLAPGHWAVATVANCNEAKNHGVLVDALKRLPDDVVWLHAGLEQPDRPEHRAVVAAGLEDRVRFLGHVRRPEHVLWAADAYAMPSLHEGLGNAALEALATGLPCVLPDVPGLRDLREHFSTLVEVGEPTADEVADGLRRARALTPAQRQDRAARQVEVARRFDRRQWAAGYLEVYRAG